LEGDALASFGEALEGTNLHARAVREGRREEIGAQAL
jgi:hypothetical protein